MGKNPSALIPIRTSAKPESNKRIKLRPWENPSRFSINLFGALSRYYLSDPHLWNSQQSTLLSWMAHEWNFSRICLRYLLAVGSSADTYFSVTFQNCEKPSWKIGLYRLLAVQDTEIRVPTFLLGRVTVKLMISIGKYHKFQWNTIFFSPVG